MASNSPNIGSGIVPCIRDVQRPRHDVGVCAGTEWALGLDRRTIQNHKQLLVELGYLKVEPADEKFSLWPAQYEPKKDAIS